MPTLGDIIREGFKDANATRYLSGIGLVILLYDHMLTFITEVRYVWSMPNTFPKIAFLLNRYIVPGALIGVAYHMNHFTGAPISDLQCQVVYGIASILGILSIGVGNILVLLRVVVLWDGNPRIRSLLLSGWLVSFTATLSLMIATLVHVLPTLIYNSTVHTCAPTDKSFLLAGTWAAPMVFETLVLVSTVYNAIDRPRASHTKLTRVLHRDGTLFFLALTTLRVVNLSVAAAAPVNLSVVGVFFVWAMTTTVLGRALLNIHTVESVKSISSIGVRSSFDGYSSFFEMGDELTPAEDHEMRMSLS